MSAAHQTLRIQWFWDNGLKARGSPNVTYTVVWGRMAHQTSQINRFDCLWLTKRYIYNCVGTHCSPNLTNTGGGAGLGNGTGMVRLLGRSRPPLHRRGKFWKRGKPGKPGKHGKRWKPGKPVSPFTKPHKYYGLMAHGSPNAMYTNGFASIAYQNHTNTMVWLPMAHQTLRILWFGNLWLPNVTNTMVLLSAAHQTLRIHWFGYTWRTNHYKYISLKILGSPIITNTLVHKIDFVHMADQTIQIQWFQGPRLTKQYEYNGLGTHGSPNFTNTMVWWSIGSPNVTYTMVWSDCSQNITNTFVWKSMARQTLRIQRFADTWLTKPYNNNSFQCFPMLF